MICVYIYIYIYVCMYVCICVYIYIYIYIYVMHMYMMCVYIMCIYYNPDQRNRCSRQGDFTCLARLVYRRLSSDLSGESCSTLWCSEGQGRLPLPRARPGACPPGHNIL